MNTYQELYEELISKLKADLEHARTLPKDGINKHVSVRETSYYGTDLETISDIEEAIKDCREDTRFDSGYVCKEAELKYDVIGWGDDTVGIEVESVSTSLARVCIRPMTDEEFDQLLGGDIAMKAIFKRFLLEKIREEYPNKTFYKHDIECNLMSLFKDGIIEYDKFVEMVKGSC